MINSARTFLNSIVGTACSILLTLMVIVLSWQVLSRYAFNAPSTFSEEVLRYGMIWSSLLGAAYACGRGSHMAIYLLRDITDGRVRHFINLLTPLAFILFASAILLVGGLRAVSVAQSQMSPVLQIPMVWVYGAMPVGGALMVIYSILDLIEVLSGKQEEANAIEQTLAAGD